MRSALRRAVDQVERFDALRRACDKLPTRAEELADLERRLNAALAQVRRAQRRDGRGKGGGKRGKASGDGPRRPTGKR